jgi:hypothetical protein
MIWIYREGKSTVVTESNEGKMHTVPVLPDGRPGGNENDVHNARKGTISMIGRIPMLALLLVFSGAFRAEISRQAKKPKQKELGRSLGF